MKFKITPEVKKILLIAAPSVLAFSIMIMLIVFMGGAEKKEDNAPIVTVPPVTSEKLADVMAQITEPQSTAAQTAPIIPSGSYGLSYVTKGDGTCSVTGIGTCRDSTVTIPEMSPAGDRVVAIASNAFINCTSVKDVIIPEGIVEIGACSFYGSGIRNITIPESVTYIGNSAFANCLSLSSIEVDRENSNYSSKDGVLFSSDMSILVCYPSGKTELEYKIEKDVVRIETMAFYNCSALKKIRYAGTESEWKRIDKGVSNESLNNAEKEYSADSGK